MQTKKQTKFAVFFITLMIFVFLFFPLYVMFVTALKNNAEVYTYPPVFWPKTPIWHNFIQVWTEIPLANFLISSLVIAGGATILVILVGTTAAYSIARLRFPGRKAILNATLVTQILSPVVIIIPFFKMMVSASLTDSYLSLIIANAAFTLAFSIWLMTGYFSTIPYEIEEAAFVDGCSRMKTMWRIVLPLSGPGLVTMTIFSFVTSWNEFMMALTLITTPEKKPVPVGIFQLIGKFEIQWNLLCAGAIISTIPALVLFLLIQKHIISGLVSGSVKS